MMRKILMSLQRQNASESMEFINIMFYDSFNLDCDQINSLKVWRQRFRFSAGCGQEVLELCNATAIVVSLGKCELKIW